MNFPGKKSLCKAFAVAACATAMTGCAIVPMDPYYPAPVVVLPAPVVVGPVWRPYHQPHYYPAPGHGHGHRR